MTGVQTCALPISIATLSDVSGGIRGRYAGGTVDAYPRVVWVELCAGLCVGRYLRVRLSKRLRAYVVAKGGRVGRVGFMLASIAPIVLHCCTECTYQCKVTTPCCADILVELAAAASSLV